MNIAIFTDTYLPQINGVVTSISIFKETLEKKGHKVYIFAPYINQNQQKDDDDTIFRFKSAKFVFQPEYRISWPYSRAINNFKKLEIDIVHSQTPFTMGLLASYIAKKYKKPLVHTYHTLFTEYVHYLPIPRDYAKNFAKWASKSFCNTNHLVIAPSDQVKSELANYDVTTPVEVIPTGINLTDVHKVSTKATASQYNLDSKLTYLSTISRLGKEKNIEFLLNSFKLINEKKTNTRLIIIGDGPEKKKLVSICKKLKIEDKITFTGYIERNLIFPILKYSKLFIFASKTETQGLVLLEAMSMKIPVVAVDAMGVSSIMNGNIGGYLSEENAEIFADHAAKLLTDEELYENKCNEAYHQALALSANKMTQKLIQCYERMLQ